MTDMVELVLQINGNLTVSGYLALQNHYVHLDADFIHRLNALVPTDAEVGRKEIERCLFGPSASRVTQAAAHTAVAAS